MNVKTNLDQDFIYGVRNRNGNTNYSMNYVIIYQRVKCILYFLKLYLLTRSGIVHDLAGQLSVASVIMTGLAARKYSSWNSFSDKLFTLFISRDLQDSTAISFSVTACGVKPAVHRISLLDNFHFFRIYFIYTTRVVMSLWHFIF